MNDEFDEWFKQYTMGDFDRLISESMDKWHHLLVVETERSIDLRVRQRRIFKLNKQIKAYYKINDYYPYVVGYHEYMLFFFPNEEQFMAATSYLTGNDDFKIEG